MEKIRVNTGRLKTDAEQVLGCIKDMKSEMSKMKESVAQLDQMWDGPSSEAFAKVFQDDMEALNTILENLDKVYEYEVTAKEKYEECENKVSDLISQIRV